MNFYESDILKLEKRIKRIEENLDPTKLKTNKMLYELQLEQRKAQLKAWREGKPFGLGDGPLAILSQAMGFIPVGRARAAHDTMESAKYIELGRARGLPVDNSCDMTYISFALAESGDLPPEDIFVCDQSVCTSTTLADKFMSYTQKRFTYYLDIGIEQNEANIEHVTNQLGGFIEFAEKKYPGVIKYNEDKLIELQTYSEAVRNYYFDVYHMLKHKPSPIAGKDAVWQNYGLNQLYPNPARLVKYARARRDEMAERVEKGIATVPGEKLRVIWTVTRPFFMDPFKVLEKWGIAVLLAYAGGTVMSVPFPRPTYWSGRELTPLEKVAADAISGLWSGLGTRWIDNMIWVCKDLNIDAIVNYNMLGCTATLGLKKLVEERAENELGIPTLQLEGKQWDSNYADEATITAKLDEFAQMLLSRKGFA